MRKKLNVITMNRVGIATASRRAMKLNKAL